MRKDKNLVIRVTETERDAISAFAKDRGFDVSKFVLALIREAMSNEPLLPLRASASERALSAPGRGGQDVRSNTAHLSQNETTPTSEGRNESD